MRGCFRVRGDIVEVFPAHEDSNVIRFEFYSEGNLESVFHVANPNTVISTIGSNSKPSEMTNHHGNNNQNNHSKTPQNTNIRIEWTMVEKYLEKTLTHKGQLKNYLEKSIWEDLEKRNFQIAISLLKIIASNTTHNSITQATLFNQLKNTFPTNELVNACNWLINVGLLYEEEIEHQDCYYIRIPLLSQWIQMQMTEEEIEQCRIL